MRVIRGRTGWAAPALLPLVLWGCDSAENAVASGDDGGSGGVDAACAVDGNHLAETDGGLAACQACMIEAGPTCSTSWTLCNSDCACRGALLLIEGCEGDGGAAPLCTLEALSSSAALMDTALGDVLGCTTGPCAPACGNEWVVDAGEAGTDAGLDASSEATLDASGNTPSDATLDASFDDSSDATLDASADASGSGDATLDASADASDDGGGDAPAFVPGDAGSDAPSSAAEDASGDATNE